VAPAVVLEEDVAAADRRDEEVLVAVVVGVGERGRDLTRSARPTPASRVMLRNRPFPRFFQSSLPPSWLRK